MIPTFQIKKGNLLPSVKGQCFDGTGKPQPLTGAAIKFRMWNHYGIMLVDNDATLVDGPNGKVQYDWQAGETDVPGTYLCEFRAVFPGDKPITFPNDSDGRVIIMDVP